MPWATSYPNRARFTIDEADGDTIASLTTEANVQRKQARDTAQALITSGAVGDPNGEYKVALHGHVRLKPADGDHVSEDVLAEHVGVYVELVPQMS